MDAIKYAIGAALAPLFWLVILSVSLWIVRRWFPRAEAILFASPITGLRLLLRELRAIRLR
jgi:hypothetical protein